ncbi:MAG: hypothetical protein JXN64_11675 [Spirochaetes bacterium]|nr:hypothetical protein [Spirochaetota bacterium]
MKSVLKISLNLSISIIICFCFNSCKDWEYNITKNGVHFKKIHQSGGSINIGYMSENHNIQGFPCEQGWIHFNKDWKLLSFQLSKDYIYKSIVLPAHTWIHFPNNKDQYGYICSFPYNYKIQGYLCKGDGGYKGTQTAFYESGKLRSFFAPEDVIVDGVPCKAGLLTIINLYENGGIKSCTLAQDYQADGKTFVKGKAVIFDKNGKIKYK